MEIDAKALATSTAQPPPAGMVGKVYQQQYYSPRYYEDGDDEDEDEDGDGTDCFATKTLQALE